MNAALQWLIAFPGIKDYFINKKYKREVNYKENFEFADAFSELISGDSSGFIMENELRYFKQLVAEVNPKFKENTGQDCHEFLSALLEGLSSDLNKIQDRPKGRFKADNKATFEEQSERNWKYSKECEDSFINDQFEGQLVYIMKWESWKENTFNFENFTTLSLEIPEEKFSDQNDCTLEELFIETTKNYTFSSEMGYNWPLCKQTASVEKSMKICRLPELLILHLKRFNIENAYPSKNLRYVYSNKDDLDLSIFWTENWINNSAPTYQLYAVSNHIGNLRVGHYTADVKNLSGDQKWYHWDDDIIRATNPSNPSKKSYILFYRRSQ